MVSQIFSAVGQDKIILPDESFINDATIVKEGDNLVLTSPNGEIVVIEEYFTTTDSVDITSPNGGFLSSELIDSFIETSHSGQYANLSSSVNDTSPAGQMTDVKGEVWILRADGTRVGGQEGSLLYEGDIVETADGSNVNIAFADNSSFVISDNARLSIDEYIYDSEQQSGSSFFSMLKGAFVYTSGVIGKEDPENVNIETPVGSIGIRGTVVVGNIKPAGETSEITVLDGAIVISNAAGLVELNSNFETVQLSSYDSVALNIGQVDSSYLSSNYNFEPAVYNSIDTMQNHRPTNSTPANKQAPKSDSESKQDGDSTQDGGKDAQPTEQQGAADTDTIVTEATIKDANPLVQKMINYQTQQQVEGASDMLSLLGDASIAIPGKFDGKFIKQFAADAPNDWYNGGIDEDEITNETDTNTDDSLSGNDGNNGGGTTAPEYNITGMGGNGFEIHQLQSEGTIVGRVNIDGGNHFWDFNITDVNNLTDNIDIYGLLSIKDNGDIVIANEIVALAKTNDVDLTFDIEVTAKDGSGNFVIEDLAMQVTNFNDNFTTDNHAIDGGNATVAYGGDGNDYFYFENYYTNRTHSPIADNAGDVLLGGRGSDAFKIDDFNFLLIDGGIRGDNSLITENMHNYTFLGDTVILTDDMVANEQTIDFTDSNIYSKFKNIENFAFELEEENNFILNLDAEAVLKMTDPDSNILSIWGIEPNSPSTTYTVNLSGGFVQDGDPMSHGGVTSYKYTANNGATVLIHDTPAIDATVNIV